MRYKWLSRRFFLVLFVILMFCRQESFLFAQNYSGDARKLALGGVANVGRGNIVFEMVPSRFGYSSIVIPLGLLQVFQNTDVFDPDKPDFDLNRIIDYVGNPLHYTWDRDQRESQRDFLDNIREGELSRDLNAYRGFVPPSDFLAEGLLAPNWGHTFKFAKKDNESYQGIYVGAGPYLSINTHLTVDQNLINILQSTQNVYYKNTILPIKDTAFEQAALAITGGYRAKFPFWDQSLSGASERNGIYFAANYNYLRGFRYDDLNFDVRIPTDSAGLIALVPTQTPVVIDQLTSTSGNGFSVDLGIATILDNWELGFGANGIANRIQWDELKHKQFTLNNLLTGGDFTDRILPAPAGSKEVELPTQYSFNLAYHRESWSAMADYSHGFEKNSFHGGGEYRFSWIAFRGGGRLSRELWEPTGGIGLNLGSRLSVDLAVFATTANIERDRELSTAVSLRINPRP